MKKILLFFVMAGLMITSVLAQAPQSFKYQAIARDNNGDIIANQDVNLEVNIVQSSERGAVVYTERHSLVTNDFGLINLEIGTGEVRMGDFRSIDWGGDSHFVQIAIDLNGGEDYQVMGTARLLSVPYALYAEQSGSQRLDDLDWGKYFDNVYTGTGNSYPIGNVGIGTFQTSAKLHVQHINGFSSTFRRVVNSPGNALFLFQKSRGNFNTMLPAENGDNIGQLRFEAYTGSDFEPAGWIRGAVDGPINGSIVPGNLLFATTGAGRGPTEHMRITSGGFVGIGTATPGSKLHVYGDLNLMQGTNIFEFSTDTLLSDDSNDAVPTEHAVKWYVDNTIPGQDILYHNVLIRFDSLNTQIVNSTVFDEDTYVWIDNNLDVDGWLDVEGQTDLAASGVPTNVRGTLNVTEKATFLDDVDVLENTHLYGMLTVDSIAYFNALNNSTNKDEGAVVINNGGLGVEQNITAGGDIWAYQRLISGQTITIDGTQDPGTIEESHGKLSFVDDTLVTTGVVGVGLTFPKAGVHVTKDDGVIAEGTYGSGSLGVEGAGVRMLWYPKKAAFRAGYANDTSMNDIWIGEYSAAFGNQTIAVGSNSVAGGLLTYADRFATAFGNNSEANGRASVAIGDHVIADGDYSAAFGDDTKAEGIYSTAIGQLSKAVGTHSFAGGQSANASGNAAFAYGDNVNASGDHSFAYGYQTYAGPSATLPIFREATGQYAFAGGAYTRATGIAAVSLGYESTASGDYSFAYGYNTYAGPDDNVVIGNDRATYGTYAFAGGYFSEATGEASVALGYYSNASGDYSFAGGYEANATGVSSFAFGNNAVTKGYASAAFGASTLADGDYTFASGGGSNAVGYYSVAMGQNAQALGYGSAAIGENPAARGAASASFGFYTDADGDYSFAAGNNSYANGTGSAAFGYYTNATGLYSFATGQNTRTTGQGAFTTGYSTLASGNQAYAGGNNSIASGNYAIAHGEWATASARASAAFGINTEASGLYSLAMGYYTDAEGISSFAGGNYSNVSGQASFAYGVRNTADGGSAAAFGRYSNADAFAGFVVGQYNVGGGTATSWVNTDPVFEIGIGTSSGSRQNAMTVYKNGSATMMGPVTITDETESTSSTTGALIVAGGIGAGKNINAGGTVSSGSTITMDGTYNTTTWASTLDDSDFNRIHFMTDTLTTMGWIGIGDTQPEGQLDVEGWTHLDQTSIVTNDGPFNVTGNNEVLFDIADIITFEADDYAKFHTTDTLELDGDLAVLIGQSGVETTIRGSLVAEEAASFEDNLDVDGHTTLDRVTINNTDGDFAVSGPNDVNFNVTGAINLQADQPSQFTTLEQLTLGGDTTVLNGVVMTSNTTVGSAYNDAPFMVKGGAGFWQNVYMNQALNVSGSVQAQSVTSVTSLSGQSLTVNNGQVNTTFFVNGTSDIVVGNFATGTLFVPYGGVSIGGSLQVQGGLYGQLGGPIDCLRAYIDTIQLCGTDPLRILGSGGVIVESTTNATSTSTGALVVGGGAGIANDLYVGGTIYGNVSGTIIGDVTGNVTGTLFGNVGASGDCYDAYLSNIYGCSDINFNVSAASDQFNFNTGNVAIGTTDATHKLTVSSSASDDALRLWGPDGGTLGYGARLNFGDADFVYIEEDDDDDLYMFADRITMDFWGSGEGYGLGLETTNPTSMLDVNSNSMRLRDSSTPVQGTTPGYTGEMRWDASYLYICTSGDGTAGGTTWKRVALSAVPAP